MKVTSRSFFNLGVRNAGGQWDENDDADDGNLFDVENGHDGWREPP